MPHLEIGSLRELSVFGGEKLVSLENLWLDHHELAQTAAVFELDYTADLGEKSVVLAAPDIKAGLDAGAALADDDGSAGHQLSSECLDSQALRVGIAPVP